MLSECLSRDQKHDHVKTMASSTCSSIFAAIPCLCEDLSCIFLSSSPVHVSSLIKSVPSCMPAPGSPHRTARSGNHSTTREAVLHSFQKALAPLSPCHCQVSFGRHKSLFVCTKWQAPVSCMGLFVGYFPGCQCG